LHKILETEVLPRISSVTKLDAAVWTLEVDSSGDLQLLEDLILAMFPDISEVCTFNHLLAYCGPLLESYQATITRPVLLSEILSLTYAVALCFPAEVRLSKRFSAAVPVSTALLLRGETQETIWAFLKLNSSEDQKNIFSEIVISEIGIEDPRAQKLLMAELIRSSCSVNDAKLVILQKYLAKIFSKIYSHGTTHEDRESMSSKAAACMPAFLDYGNLIFFHAACQKVACQTYRWLQAAMTVLGFAKDSYTTEGTQRRADNLTRDGLLQNLIGAVAHVVYSHSRLEVVAGQLLLQSIIASSQERRPLDDGLADFALDQGTQ
jgi:hypothetical protein